MESEKLIKLQHFFTADMRIKKEMYDMAPPSDEDYLDEHSIIKYTDQVDESLMYIFSELKCIAIDIFGSESNVFKRIVYLEEVAKNKFYNCGNNIHALRAFYKMFVSDMDINFINEVKGECIGYTFGGTGPVEHATTINELLHFIHSYIVNSEYILQAIPLINEKNNNYNYPLRLRGASSPVFEQLFAMFPLDLDCGWTDLVIINEKKLIMMIRDRGHALTIEITLSNGYARIEYFIPKLCNIEMINNLPGINKVNEDSVGATGVTEVKIDELPNMLYDFISNVPTDSDMVWENPFKL